MPFANVLAIIVLAYVSFAAAAAYFSLRFNTFSFVKILLKSRWIHHPNATNDLSAQPEKLHAFVTITHTCFDV